jgi:hypothetical protein
MSADPENPLLINRSYQWQVTDRKKFNLVKDLVVLKPGPRYLWRTPINFTDAFRAAGVLDCSPLSLAKFMRS